jgi:hypothetical protein
MKITLEIEAVEAAQILRDLLRLSPASKPAAAPAPSRPAAAVQDAQVPPKKTRKRKRAAQAGDQPAEPTLADRIVALLGKGPMASNEIVKAFTATGSPSVSVYSALKDLRKKALIITERPPNSTSGINSLSEVKEE